MPSPLRQTIDLLLDNQLDQFIAANRDEGHSFEQISQAIKERTDVKLSAETIRVWAKDTTT